MLYFVGSYDELADEIERYAEQGAADGFILSSRGSLDAFIEHVLPTLQRRRLFRRATPAPRSATILAWPSQPDSAIAGKIV
jgi:hypothetical protein